MNNKWHATQYPGVRYREYNKRKHRGQPDRYFVIRYKKEGKLVGESVGWASHEMNAQQANKIRADIVQNIRKGEGYQSLAEKRQIETDRKREEELKRQLEEKEQIKFGQVTAEYLKWSEVNKKSHQGDKSRYEKHLKFLDDVRLKDISPLMLETLKGDLQKKNLSSATVHQVLALIRAIFRKAVSWKLYEGSIPTNEVTFPKLNNKRSRFLSHEEAAVLLKELKRLSKNVYNQSLLALYCGLRFGEIANLTWADIDLKAGIIHVRDAKAGDRHAFITEPVKEMFLEIKVNKPKKRNSLIFPDKKGKKQKHISRTFYKTVLDLGFNQGISDNRQKVSFHTLRHTFASWLAIQGTSLYEIKELMGHKSIEMTERYAHLMPNVKQKAVNKLAEDFVSFLSESETDEQLVTNSAT
ncbi:MAG: site-specific integrase [Desulfobacterales bacterium]|jgi:integrase